MNKCTQSDIMQCKVSRRGVIVRRRAVLAHRSARRLPTARDSLPEEWISPRGLRMLAVGAHHVTIAVEYFGFICTPCRMLL